MRTQKEKKNRYVMTIKQIGQHSRMTLQVEVFYIRSALIVVLTAIEHTFPIQGNTVFY